MAPSTERRFSAKAAGFLSRSFGSPDGGVQTLFMGDCRARNGPFRFPISCGEDRPTNLESLLYAVNHHREVGMACINRTQLELRKCRWSLAMRTRKSTHYSPVWLTLWTCKIRLAWDRKAWWMCFGAWPIPG